MKGVVSSGSVYTSKAGGFALQHGGNAIDALIASQLAAHVCEPMLTGFGGAGMATVRFQGQVVTVDMFTNMPGIGSLKDTPMMDTIVLDFGTTTQSFTVGEGSISVPTLPSGLACLHQRFGSLPIDVLAKPALELCSNGFTVSKSCGYLLKLLQPIISMSDTLSKWYCKPSGEVLEAGDHCHTPEMATDLYHFINTLDKFFIKGIYADGIKTLHNSIITIKDIEQFETKIKETTQINIGSWSIHTTKMPSVGGDLIQRFCGWNHPTKVELLHALTDAYEQIDEIRDAYAAKNCSLGNTTHISTVDSNGNAAALTSSLGESAGVVLPGTGVIMNNFLGETDVTHPLIMQNPGHRLLTMCAPLILESPSKIYALGSGGSSRIPGAMIQVIKLIMDNYSIYDAVHQSRMHPSSQNSLRQILLEPMKPEVLHSLKVSNPSIEVTMFDQQSLYFGGVHIAGLDNGVGVGVGDPRRSGSSIVFK